VRGNEALWGTPSWQRDRLAGALGMDGEGAPDAGHVAGEAAAAVAAPPADATAHGADEDAELAAWRAEARRWIRANLPPRAEAGEVGPMTVEEELAHATRARELQATLQAAGYGGITFPKAYGGAGLDLAHQQAFDAEAAEFERPLLFRVPTLSIIAPTILAHATEEQKERHIPAMLEGRELWVQLMSEPSGGSDLAGALTRATRDGDVFVVNGQKVWSTGAHYVDYGLLLVRTNPDVPKHRGLTMLIVPLRSPGVTAVPIRQINGQAEFCEVFFDDVVVPVENVVGAVDDGWTVASTLLVHERGAAGQTHRADVTADLVALARQRGRAADAVARQLVAQVHERAAVEPELVARLTAEMRAGEKPSTAGSLVKLFRAHKAQFAGHAGLEIAGPHAAAWREGDPGGERWSDDYLNSRARSIAGGTSEMQRNVIAERVLGLPREAQPDRDVPFSEARSNALPGRRGA
jgi:alkylation response protein AidB-like acyl-CoA dehydrogenase